MNRRDFIKGGIVGLATIPFLGNIKTEIGFEELFNNKVFDNDNLHYLCLESNVIGGLLNAGLRDIEIRARDNGFIFMGEHGFPLKIKKSYRISELKEYFTNLNARLKRYDAILDLPHIKGYSPIYFCKDNLHDGVLIPYTRAVWNPVYPNFRP